jgi:two-component system response regulator RegX3
MRILVADDEPAIRESVSYALRAEGFAVDEAATGQEAIRAAAEVDYDVVLLDVMLGDLSGVEICRRLRADSTVPIVMLTARDAEVDRVLGLESGADDYVTKPFSMRELVSRVRAILRRRELDLPARRELRRVGDMEIDLLRHRVTVDGRDVRVTPTELRILSLLAGEDRSFTRHEILRYAWETTFVPDGRSCDVHIANLRRKIGDDAAQPERLLTVRGIGYRLARP